MWPMSLMGAFHDVFPSFSIYDFAPALMRMSRRRVKGRRSASQRSRSRRRK
jgi:hypothetical protein